MSKANLLRALSQFIMPANYSVGTFEGCEGDVAMAPGIISTWTFTQGDPVTPSARSAPASSNCQAISSPVGLSASTGAAAAAAATGTSGALAVGNKAAAAVAGGSASAAAPTYSGSAGMASSESGSTSGASSQHGGAATTALAVVVAGFVAAVALVA